jgi:hypothetical protein
MMLDCWHIFSDMQNLPKLGIAINDIFTRDELFRLWQWDNAEDIEAYGLIDGCSLRYHLNSYRIAEDVVNKEDSIIRIGIAILTICLLKTRMKRLCRKKSKAML